MQLITSLMNKRVSFMLILPSSQSWVAGAMAEACRGPEPG